MSANRLPPTSRVPVAAPRRQAGNAAVEFGLVVIVFLVFVLAVIEVARVMYLWNTLQEVTRRAANTAASTDFSDVGAMNAVRQRAIFRTSPGPLVVGKPVTDANVRIDYMSLARAPDGRLTLTEISALPSCPARNRIVCATDQNASNCIRFVRVRICASGGSASTCVPIPYKPMLPLVKLPALTLPLSTTIVRAETLGYQPGQSLCN